MAVTQIHVLSYKDDLSFFPAGAGRAIHCDYTFYGTWYINTKGEIIPVPSSRTPIGQPGSQATFVDAGKITDDSHLFADAGFKTVYKVKDNVTGITTYVDTASWDTNSLVCNPITYPSICGVTTNLAVVSPTPTTANFTATAGVNATGYEYVNQVTPGVAPIVAGTFSSNTSIALTGLTGSHAYRFWIRTICGAGYKSAWVSVDYTTHA